MSIASENGKVYKEMRRGLIDPAFAAKLSTVLMNQRAIVETTTIEAQIAELETALLAPADRRPLQTATTLPKAKL